MMDLTPFGFTPTESLVYAALVERGSTSAYAIAKHLGIARANVYQALNGLVSKGAARLISEDPRVFRPISPQAILALIIERESSDLEVLHAQVEAHPGSGEPTTVEFGNDRVFRELALRTAVRAESVRCLAPPEVLVQLNPLWHKRLADNTETKVWGVGRGAESLPLRLEGIVPSTRVQGYFGSPAALVLAPGVAIVAVESESGTLSGHWTSDTVSVGLAQAAWDALTAA
jgi:sugar-specific transcriptional regulator TrmB